jgi:hypothetical protein
MKPDFNYYVGIDWATQTHRVCNMKAEGEILREQTIKHDGNSVTELLDELDKITDGRPEQVGVAIEVPRGPVVEAFLACSIHAAVSSLSERPAAAQSRLKGPLNAGPGSWSLAPATLCRSRKRSSCLGLTPNPA